MRKSMNKFLNKKLIINLIIIGVFAIISLVYFYPLLSGKQIKQSDIDQFSGMSKQIVDHREKYDEEPFWLDNAFLGMPSYQVLVKYPFDILDKIDKLIRFLPRPADYLFVYLVSFFLLLLSMKVKSEYAFFGAIAFAFSTYLIIILGVGHNTKALAIGYAPLIFAGLFKVLDKKYLSGFILSSIGLGLQINANHYQMTYYFLMLVGLITMVYVYNDIVKKDIQSGFKKLGLVFLTTIFAILLNASSILATQEYTDFSTRGKSEISINPDGTEKEKLGGLSNDYITEYSYGKLESLNLIVPRFMGGGSSDLIDKNSDFVKEIRKYDNESANIIYRNARLYWGNQPIVAAPAYIGISVFYIFLIALLFIEKQHLKWILPALIFSLILSWGKNFSFVTDLMIDYFPFYDKFRAVSSIQVIIEFIIPFVASMGLFKYFQLEKINKEKYNALFFTTGFFLSSLIILLLFGSQFLSFKSEMEVFSSYPEILDLLVHERQEVFKSDLIRSISIVIILSLIFWATFKNFIKKNYSLGLITIIVLFDLWNIDMKYVNEENFTRASKVKTPFTINEIDKEILRDDSHFRIYEPYRGFVNGRSSYFHNSISGYHAAKPKRMQDLYDFYLSKRKLNVLNMLNVKYTIDLDENSSLSLKVNEENLGNVWFVENLVNVENTNQEILMLDQLDYSKTCLSTMLESKKYEYNSNNNIELISRKSNELIYEYNSSNDNFVVFSEAFYSKGWESYIGDIKVNHNKVNYLLRGMEVPKGKHKIKFIFNPGVIKKGSIIMASSNFMLLILIGLYFKRKLIDV
ncbi:MAG: hypothetical protein CMD13_01710 [Flavobacteriales bacterium]|nr:hypothetical protein [Flavobacteriales bacterium]